jgi:hypothetical protein
MGHATAVLVRHDDPEIGSIVVATLWDIVAPPTTPFG